MEAIALFVLLVGAFIAILLLIVWQGGRGGGSHTPLEYVIDDAVRHVVTRLQEGSSLSRKDVKRILEWEVFYLQGLAQDDRHKPVETVAGGHRASIDYIQSEIETNHGVAYSHGDIEDVLRLEADYLMAIGAVGEPVELGEEE